MDRLQAFSSPVGAARRECARAPVCACGAGVGARSGAVAAPDVLGAVGLVRARGAVTAANGPVAAGAPPSHLASEHAYARTAVRLATRLASQVVRLAMRLAARVARSSVGGIWGGRLFWDLYAQIFLGAFELRVFLFQITNRLRG